MTSDLQGRPALVQEIRDRAEAEMRSIGIDGAFIDRLVETFYGRIRAHAELGPVFDAHLDGRWPEHLQKMKHFWSSIAFRNGAYGGKPVQAHLGVEGMAPTLFPQWLALFSATLADIAPTPEAEAWFAATAERIARSLTLSLFYNPALDDPAARPA